MTKERIVFIINPVSGKKNNNQIDRIIERNIDRDRYDIKIKRTKSKGDGTLIAWKQYIKGVRNIVVVGGDGTVNEVASALINTDARLGIVPTGSGNGLARHLKIPMMASKAVALLNQPVIKKIDCGLVNSMPFFCTCGVGFDAKISKLFAKSVKRGFYSYVRLTLREFCRHSPTNYSIELDHQKQLRLKAFLITFANASQYGNNVVISPKSVIDDGLLDICMLAPFKKRYVLGIGWRLFRKTINHSKYYEHLKAKHILLKREKKKAVHIDGDYIRMKKKLEIEIIPQALNVMVSK